MSKKAIKDTSTEEKIKQAARIVFTKKGFAATRTRDIAEEAGINLALLNYYFRSKEKLFQQVMMEKVQMIFGVLFPIANNSETTLEEKVALIVENYVDLLLLNPDLPLFVLSEIRNNPEHFENKVGINMIKQSSLISQLKEKRADVNPIQFLISLLGMTIFPFVASPMLHAAGLVEGNEFTSLMQQRKQLIPLWINSILDCK
ncbi:MAG TPA: TetR/AcrR family transcriptional regulator [Flavobacterium sp.]|nr:TetR/AcrR family transcriptional regulator [Flavobacterium sp.]